MLEPDGIMATGKTRVAFNFTPKRRNVGCQAKTFRERDKESSTKLTESFPVAWWGWNVSTAEIPGNFINNLARRNPEALLPQPASQPASQRASVGTAQRARLVFSGSDSIVLRSTVNAKRILWN